MAKGEELHFSMKGGVQPKGQEEISTPPTIGMAPKRSKGIEAPFYVITPTTIGSHPIVCTIII